jgi:hypothetical protein
MQGNTLWDQLEELNLEKKELIQQNVHSFLTPKKNLESGAAVPKTIGIEVPSYQLVDYFDAAEGSIELIYGRIRNGKSTHAVRLMYTALKEGRVIYSNLLLDLSQENFDQRDAFEQVFWKLFFGKKRYFVFDKRNYHWFNPTTGECDGKVVFDPNKKGDEIAWLNTLTDCEIFYDEGQWLLDSYEMTNVSVAKRKLITETGHNNRKIYIIAQRTQSVHVNARGNVNIFWKCKKQNWFFWSLLVVYEFQDMKGQDVDEDAEPVSVQKFWSSNQYWRMFNTHYLRAGKPRSQEVYFKAYDYTRKEQFVLMWRNFGEPSLKRGFAILRAMKLDLIHFIHRVAKRKTK